MSSKADTSLPIMLLTHTRACSTAFERVFMTRRDSIICFNEPFADPSFFGPEACVERHHANGERGASPGFENCTFKERIDLIQASNRPEEGKHAFVKDMAFQLSVWRGDEKKGIAKSLLHLQSHNDIGNPSVIPFAVLQRFQWTFLIRHPQQSIPSLFRLSATKAKREDTGWKYFLASEAGYYELRQIFDYLLRQGVIPCNSQNGNSQQQKQEPCPCLIDADDLLQQPEEVVETYCKYIGLDYTPAMLQWNTKEDDDHAARIFATWTGFHRDAIESRGLQARKKRAPRSKEDDYYAWVTEFGEQGAALIKRTIEENLPHYLYLKQFAVQFEG